MNYLLEFYALEDSTPKTQEDILNFRLQSTMTAVLEAAVLLKIAVIRGRVYVEL